MISKINNNTKNNTKKYKWPRTVLTPVFSTLIKRSLTCKVQICCEVESSGQWSNQDTALKSQWASEQWAEVERGTDIPHEDPE